MLLQAMQQLINGVIGLDAQAQVAFKPLAGKVIGIEVNAPVLRFCLQITPVGNVRCIPYTQATPDVVIKGTYFELMRLLSDNLSADQSTIAQGATINGDLALAQQLARIMRQFDWDFEEVLASALGDHMAHLAGQRMHRLWRWSQTMLDHMAANIGDYLLDETHQIASQEAVADFMLDIDRTRDDIERLSARIERLELGHAILAHGGS